MKIKKNVVRGAKFVKNSLKDGKAQVGKSLRSQDALFGRPQKATVGQALANPILTGMAFTAGVTRRTRRRLGK